MEDESNNNVKLLGMPRENDWVLYGPYADKSLLRNVLIFQLANEMGRYAPRTDETFQEEIEEELVIFENAISIYPNPQSPKQILPFHNQGRGW